MKTTLIISLFSLNAAYGYVTDFSRRNVVPYVKGSRRARSDEIGFNFDYENLFQKIQEVSPLAKMTMQEPDEETRRSGLAGLDGSASCSLKWKTVEKKKGSAVTQIERCDGYNNIKAPLLRFRAELSGPCVGEYFGQYILDLEARKKWDSQVANVYEMHQIDDLDAVNIAMGFGRHYGDLTRMGIGYGQTKAGLGISPREQMFLYGMQDFPDGSCVLWGAEMDDEYNHLLPEGTRHTRSRSHLFSATLIPTGPDTFDIEYVLQLEIGGGMPSFLTTPVVIDTVKSLFNTAKAEFASKGGELASFIAQQRNRDFAGDLRLLMTP
mmetsp:Transcript_16167/g.21144  ORF Transcript_16167/g.21144 Transcript_16167/m.21144 type:complete len:323 (+) Transcript_16167:38-1006(+)